MVLPQPQLYPLLSGNLSGNANIKNPAKMGGYGGGPYESGVHLIQ